VGHGGIAPPILNLSTKCQWSPSRSNRGPPTPTSQQSLPVTDILVEIPGYADEEILVTNRYSNLNFSVVEPVDRLPEDMHLLLYVDRQLNSYIRHFTVRIFSTS